MRLSGLGFLVGLLMGAMDAAPPRESGLPTAAVPAVPGSGKDLYRAHCASCHGLAGKGDGPVADSMRMRPTDLTLLARSNGGKFPEFRLRKMLGGGDDVPAHGVKQMPVWGPLLTSGNPGDARNSLVVGNLIAYLQGIQARR